MNLAIASDHAGFVLKQELLPFLSGLGHAITDLGAYNAEPSDYPDFAKLVGESIMRATAQRGILICGSGVGVSIAANKIPGVRAAVCHDTYSAHQGVEHDDMNLLVLGSRIVGVALARDIADRFLAAVFDNQVVRFARRLQKLEAIERFYMPRSE